MSKFEFEIQEFDTDQTSEELIEKYIDYLLRRVRYLEPDDPEPSRELLRKNVIDKHPHIHQFRWIGINKANNEIIGSAILGFVTKDHPSYENEKGRGFGGVGTDINFRKNGLGKALITPMIIKMKDVGIHLFQTDADEEDGINFLRNLEIGVETISGVQNRLYLKDVDWDKMEDWRKSGSLKARNVKLQAFNEVPETELENFCTFLTTAMNSVPKGESEWDPKITPESRRVDEERRKERGDIWRTMISREEEGAISGVTEIIYNFANNHQLYQELTAVLPEYRGRGLGKWLKSEMLFYIRDNYPEVKYIITGNADINAPMLAINNQMGYKNHKQGYGFKFTIEELIKKFVIE
ncbi:MAG: GNAT family N-acetyltransferase [Candidatus Heimdallarchaeota archaeon]|nr:GNAT family N-acetyltransferase [Candidatus Heimdallarchaeota archaeon]MDH5645388.1 GNAT family N-acetyltransferase [Candidatus Heimdallarchaeota archaeon]